MNLLHLLLQLLLQMLLNLLLRLLLLIPLKRFLQLRHQPTLRQKLLMLLLPRPQMSRLTQLQLLMLPQQLQNLLNLQT
jgi:hypothetical protein